MSTPLPDAQHRFFAAVRGGDPADALEDLADSGKLSAETGLAIYRNAYRSRLVEALESDHAQLGAYLGDALWQTLCEGYIAAHPSRVRSLRLFGDDLPAYLAATKPFADNPQIAELARWERRLLDSFDAADGPRADWAGLAALDPGRWPSLSPRLHASVQPLDCEWNCVEIWQALKAGQTPPPARQAPTRWLVWRDPEQVTRFRSLAPQEAQALELFLAGQTLSEVCDRLLVQMPAEEVAPQVLAWLRRWADEGCVGRWQADAAELRLAADPSVAPASDRSRPHPDPGP